MSKRYRSYSSKAGRPAKSNNPRRRLALANAQVRLLSARRAQLGRSLTVRAQRAWAASLGSGREHKTYDPVVLSTNYLSAATDSNVAVSGTSYITAGASAHVLNQIPLGTTSTTRIGRKLLMKSVLLSGYIINGATSATVNSVRLALVYIPRLNTSTTTMPPQNTIWTVQNAAALRLIDNVDRFKVIREWTFDMIGDVDNATTGCEMKTFKMMVPLRLPTVFTQADTSGSFNDMEEGALCLYCQGSQTLASNAYSNVIYNARVYFEDQ